MELKKLSINHLRNLDSEVLEPETGFNLIYGENGAGKTSVLEAIHILSHGRSFRGGRINPLIQHDQDKFWVSGQVSHETRIRQLGVERSKKNLLVHLDGEKVNSILQHTECFPTLVLHPGTFTFLTAEPAYRRAFIDWGVFYEDAGFIEQWKLYQKALKQRNSALRQGLAEKYVAVWNQPLAKAGEYIDHVRRLYIDQILQEIPELLSRFRQSHSIEITYKSGWAEGQGLQTLLDRSFDSDVRQGFTHIGPHRADIIVKLNAYEVSKFASRGQLKLLTVILKLAQCALFVKKKGIPCVLLLDDLASELDKRNFTHVLQVVADLKLQSFITSIEPIKKIPISADTQKLFHVKHGSVREVI
jgi:DNA replication and repair protein RecF